MKWNSQDPREVHVDDRGEIVIDVIEDGHHRLVGAWVWVLDWDQWTIDLEREINGITSIGAGDDWPDGWRWISIPSRDYPRTRRG